MCRANTVHTLKTVPNSGFILQHVACITPPCERAESVYVRVCCCVVQNTPAVGFLARARSGALAALLGRPKTEEELQAELEAAEAAAAAEAEAQAAADAKAAHEAMIREPEKEPPIR